MRFVSPAVVSVLGLASVLGACDAASSDGAFSPAPALAAAAAGSGGAVIVRGTTLAFLVHLDSERGLLSVHAPSNVCTIGSLNQAEFKFVITPSAIGQFIAQLKSDDEQVAVYQASSFAEAGMTGTAEIGGLGDIVDFTQFCGFLEGPARIAEGSVRRVSNLSNASFTAHWVGTIQGVGGEDVKITELYQLGADAQDPNNTDAYVVHVSKILLSPRG